jgi:hypothetical protein
MTTVDILGRSVTLDVAPNEMVVDVVVILRTQSAEDPNSRITPFGSSGDNFITMSMIEAATDMFGFGEFEGDES